MISIKTIFVAVFAVVTICASHLGAQNIKKGPRPEKSVPDPLLAEAETRNFLFPEFYHFWPTNKSDTLLRYDCYDGNNNLIIPDTLENINNVQHIYFVKSFVNYMHTYIDPDGKPKPSPVTKTIYRYDRTGNDSWSSFDVENTFISELREHKNEIVRADTTLIANPTDRSNQYTIRKYYRIEEIKKKEEVEPDNNADPQNQNGH